MNARSPTIVDSLRRQRHMSSSAAGSWSARATRRSRADTVQAQRRSGSHRSRRARSNTAIRNWWCAATAGSFDGRRSRLRRRAVRTAHASGTRRGDSFAVNEQRHREARRTCSTPPVPRDRPTGCIRADSLSIDTATSTGTARDARVEFFGVPLLRLPVISFPVGNARKSGFLFPSLGTSTRGGVQLSVPWYWNIAPQQDFTFTPTWYTARGIDLEGEYRYLTRNSRGELLGNLLPNDDNTGRARSRWRLEQRHRTARRLAPHARRRERQRRALLRGFRAGRHRWRQHRLPAAQRRTGLARRESACGRAGAQFPDAGPGPAAGRPPGDRGAALLCARRLADGRSAAAELRRRRRGHALSPSAARCRAGASMPSRSIGLDCQRRRLFHPAHRDAGCGRLSPAATPRPARTTIPSRTLPLLSIDTGLDLRAGQRAARAAAHHARAAADVPVRALPRPVATCRCSIPTSPT